jgi:iron complex outermembrane recepter protein
MNKDKYKLLQAASVAGALALALAAPAHAQDQTAPVPETQATEPQPESSGGAVEEDIYGEEGGEIVVTGVRRGSVIGDIPPENELNARDIRATGATDITELLDALAPQIGSARGRGGERPVLLLNGQRISGFREIRDIPTEAISRVEILPEEVALKYGYRADQRVVNIVLRERFRSTVARLDGTTATEGGYLAGRADLSRLQIDKGSRLTANLRVEGNSALTEDERDIALRDPDAPDDRSARTLIGSKKLVRGTTTLNKTVLGDVGATVNAEVEYNEGRSLFGLSGALVPLVRDTNSEAAHLGFALNGNKGKWRWSATGNGDVARSESRSDRRDDPEIDRAETLTASGDVDLLANGPLFALPAGDASATFKVGASTLHLDGVRRREGDLSSNDLARTLGTASANIDLPISRRNRSFSALGNLTLNANAEVEQLSDFGTLTAIGAGLNWSPVARLNLITSWTREEGAPSVQQLGDPIFETPGTRVFDFRRNETVEAIARTGGNPDLLSDKRNVLKVGANWRPLEETDLRVRVDYVRSRIDRPISSFFGVSGAIEAAFPERFVRAPCAPAPCIGELVSVDLRPINFDEARRDTIRWGFDFSKPLRSARPSPAAIERFRGQRNAQELPNQPAEGAAPSPPREGGAPREDAAPPADGVQAAAPPGGGGRGFGRFGGRGRQGGRLQFSLTHTINLVDEVTIRPGLPELDYLHGDALGSTGGRPRHEVEAQAGYFNNGLGARLSANWRSGTRVDSDTGDDLRFSPLATFDLRLFANLGERFDLVSKHPWLRGSSVRFEVNNIFDAKPRVRNSTGRLPIGYEPDLLDPLGRTISISFRKLFLPPRSFFRRQRNQSPQG